MNCRERPSGCPERSCIASKVGKRLVVAAQEVCWARMGRARHLQVKGKERMQWGGGMEISGSPIQGVSPAVMSPAVSRISSGADDGVPHEVLWEFLCTATILHARAVGFHCTAWPVHHVLGDQRMKFTAFFWELRADDPVNLFRCLRLGIPIQNDEEVGMW